MSVETACELRLLSIITPIREQMAILTAVRHDQQSRVPGVTLPNDERDDAKGRDRIQACGR